ncbi:MAG: amidohydrolase family protein [Candidatus Sumerlaeota bacterium]|nr:amidohydrolase family protein [Candidatus Sumerlaeota bacterium]
MIIDCHVHAGRADGLTQSWNTWQDIGVSLRRMDSAGIDKAVVLPIGVVNTANYAQQNRDIADMVRAHPGRLVGFAKVSQAHDKGRVSPMLREAFGELGLRGLKLHQHPTREIMDTLKEWGKPLLVDVVGKAYALRYVAESYPETPIIVAHMGKFRSDAEAHLATLWLAKRYANVYFDTSSVMLHEWLERAVEEGLWTKMIFGSDGPGCHCAVELARIRALELKPEQAEWVLGRTLSRLIGETE